METFDVHPNTVHKYAFYTYQGPLVCLFVVGSRRSWQHGRMPPFLGLWQRAWMCFPQGFCSSSSATLSRTMAASLDSHISLLLQQLQPIHMPDTSCLPSSVCICVCHLVLLIGPCLFAQSSLLAYLCSCSSRCRCWQFYGQALLVVLFVFQSCAALAFEVPWISVFAYWYRVQLRGELPRSLLVSRPLTRGVTTQGTFKTPVYL